jgi:hypothetical protein
MTTFRPLGPRVVSTASASLLQPSKISCLAVCPKRICLEKFLWIYFEMVLVSLYIIVVIFLIFV